MTGIGFAQQTASYRDVEMGQATLGGLGVDQPELDAVIGLATAVVECRWPVIRKVAGELVRVRQLD